jgi:hypothetical protein
MRLLASKETITNKEIRKHMGLHYPSAIESLVNGLPNRIGCWEDNGVYGLLFPERIREFLTQ